MAGLDSSQAGWIKGSEVRSSLCISFRTQMRLVAQGKIGVLDIDGVGKKMFWGPDVAALLEKGTRRASDVQLVEA